MSSSKSAVKDEYLAQLGYKRGSKLVPFAAFALILFALYIAFTPIGNRATQIFADTCENAFPAASYQSQDTAAPIPQDPQPSATPPQNLTKFFALCAPGAFDKGTFEQRIYSFSELMQNDVAPFIGDNFFGFFPAFLDLIKGYFRTEFVGQASEASGRLIGSQLWILTWTVGLALIPGILGMIYRRAFWWWFGMTFIPLLLLAEIRWYNGLTTTPLVYLFYFLAFQLIALTLAFRLRRYAADTTGSTKLYNGIVAAGLIGIAVLWYFVLRKMPGLASVSSLYQWEFILIGLPLIYSLVRRSDLWAGTAPKNIVVCLDGTTNTPDQFEFGQLAQTNVFKLFKMLKADKVGSTAGFNATFNKSYGDKQIGLYYSGVGNRYDYNPIVQVLGGLSGLGSANVVSRAYLDVMRVYRPGDRIFIFGFSRGAAIARLLARAIDQKGAPQTIWALNLLERHLTVWTSKRRGNVDTNVPVTVLGCWDTVGSFGIGKNIAGIQFQKLDLFKDLSVPDNVEQAYHMVALDEKREEFQPTLMEPDPLRPGRIVEVWFSGDHANVGGGWSTAKLSDLTLDFQLRHVSSGYAYEPAMTPGDEAWGLYLDAVNATKRPLGDSEKDSNAVEVRPDALGHLRRWDSRLFVYTKRPLPNHAAISETVFERMRRATPLYAPENLIDHHRDVTARHEKIVADVNALAETGSLSSDERDQILTIAKSMSVARFPMAMPSEQTNRVRTPLNNPPQEPSTKNT